MNEGLLSGACMTSLECEKHTSSHITEEILSPCLSLLSVSVWLPPVTISCLYIPREGWGPLSLLLLHEWTLVSPVLCACSVVVPAAEQQPSQASALRPTAKSSGFCHQEVGPTDPEICVERSAGPELRVLGNSAQELQDGSLRPLTLCEDTRCSSTASP